MSPRNSGSVDFNLGHYSASQMQDSNLPVAHSAGEQSTASCTGSTVNNAQSVFGTVGTVGTIGPSTFEQDKRKLLQQRIFMLMHAYECRINETRTNGEVRMCSISNCAVYKRLLVHMTTCVAGKSCIVHRCSTSHHIISHLSSCALSNCAVCVPIVQAYNARQQKETAAGGQTSRLFVLDDIQIEFEAFSVVESTKPSYIFQK